MDSDGVAITDEAAERIGRLLATQRDVPATAGLRIDVVAGGCSGHQYRLALDDERDGDLAFERSGVRVLVAGEAWRFVRGAHLRFDAASGGFVVDNPNVVYGCGCGSSFELADEATAV